MYRILVLFALLGAAVAQYNNNNNNNYNRDPQTAAILTEQRYLSGDGKFGAQYSQEDGVEFKEESDADGTRRGSYSYVDPSGQRRTVSYTAGKNGFQATGDHIPQAPAAVAPTPGYTPLPQYNSPQENNYNQPQYNQQPQYKPQPQQQQPQYNYQPQQQQQQYKPQPQQQPQYNYQPQQQQQQYKPQPQYQQPQQQYNQQPQYQHTTQAPHRFNPPGKLSLNRSPDGFSYSFQKS